MDFETQLNALSEEFGFNQKKVNKIYKELQTKDCFLSDGDQERKYECIYRILFEISEIENLKGNNHETVYLASIDDKELYILSTDYAINKGLFETYKKEALNDLSDYYIDYLSEHFSYNGKSELDNFYEEYNFENKDEESYHHK